MSVERADQYIGYTLLHTSAVTAMVGQRVYNGLLPQSSTLSALLPAINYYELTLIKKSSVNAETYTINCRAKSKSDARALSKIVVDLFGGTSGTGIKGSADNFDGSISVVRQAGALPETDSDCWNYPVDILITY